MPFKFLRLGLSCAFFAATLCQATELQKPSTPQSTIIIFDINDVILAPISSTSSIIWHYRWDLVKSIFNPSLVYQVTRLACHRASGDDYYDLFEVKAPRLAEMSERMTREAQPREGITELINQLHDHSYSLAIASNMSANDFAFYQQKFPALFSNFTYAKVIQKSPQGKPRCKKPSRTYFKQLKNELAEQDLIKETMLFIDNKKNNIKIGNKEGFYGIHFKSVAQLRTELTKRGILAFATN